MTTRPPWYGKVKTLLAPTDGAAKIGLWVVIAACLWLIFKGDATTRALGLVYLVSP